MMLDVRDDQATERVGAVGVRRRSTPHTPRWLAVLVALAMFLAGVGIGLLVPTDGDGAETAAPPTTEAVEDEAPASFDGPSTDEPVADVAEALLPSVVQIQVGTSGVGSGVIYSPDGKILTAAHVVQGAEQVTVVLASGDKLTGTVVGADAGNDIAVVQVDRTDLPAAPLALDEPPRVGQMAIALGSPWGLDSTVTAGIVSAVDQAIPIPGTGTVSAMLQTDAPINPGNSGGPLVNRHGEVIGINVSIFSTSGANDGVGFAVPIERAHRVAEALVGGEGFIPGFLGVGVEETADGRAGAVIASLEPGSAAVLAGLQVGDVVIEVGGTPVADPADLAAQIRSREAGDELELVIERGGETMTVEVTLGAR